MQKKINRAALATIIALALSCLSMPTIANAATAKAGATCSKVGVTSVVKLKTTQTKFTCVKSGKKLVWNKGVVSSIAPKVVLKPISLSNLDTRQVRALAYKEFARELKENSSFLPSIAYLVGPSLTQSRVDLEKAGLNMAATFWSDIYKPTDVYIGYFTENDVDWVDKAFCEGAGYCVGGPGNQSRAVSEQIQGQGSGCNFAAATRGSKGQFFYQCLREEANVLKDKQTSPHEYTHFAQIFVSGFDTPNWWLEGSAAYFGGAIGAFDGTALPATMDDMIYVDSFNYLRQNLFKIDPFSPESVAKGFKYTYRKATPQGDSSWLLAHVSYYPGALATESMVALWGMDKVKQFMIDLKGNDFDTVFEKSFGVTTDIFYNAVSKYVVAMLDEAR